ncbi:hypothetical protein TNCV_3504501 [Trichonephila clavipes]|uniref:Uncharacterized protein n=1 Tax=Trichonephila clavipes TaxID=2585209 RepID=A0A8X6VDX8_TRICX|nr:hypothetical protein TNCV_3504501 [Trichonephila clavipes]
MIFDYIGMASIKSLGEVTFQTIPGNGLPLREKGGKRGKNRKKELNGKEENGVKVESFVVYGSDFRRRALEMRNVENSSGIIVLFLYGKKSTLSCCHRASINS